MRIKKAYEIIENYITSDRYKTMAKNYLNMIIKNNPGKTKLNIFEFRRLMLLLKDKKV